jgi:hypothetical protein
MWQEKGPETYKAWWKARMKLTSWDLIPGTDSVARVANSEWFEWEDLLRLSDLIQCQGID